MVYLINGQIAFVLDSEGPIVIPFTDPSGAPYPTQADPLDLGEERFRESEFKVNSQRPLVSPTEAYQLLPDYLKTPAT